MLILNRKAVGFNLFGPAAYLLLLWNGIVKNHPPLQPDVLFGPTKWGELASFRPLIKRPVHPIGDWPLVPEV